MKNVIWFDIETTGLDENHHSILSVAAIRFDENWSNRREFYQVVYHPDPNDLLWSPAALDMHRKSGLIDRIKVLNNHSQPPVQSLEDIDKALMLWAVSPQRVILAGNSIHFDRKFVKKHLPHFERTLHYRMLDVSGICEAFRTFGGVNIPRIEFDHTALSDANNSINLMKLCLNHVKKES